MPPGDPYPFQVRTTLPIVETRLGKKVEYQDDEARKSANK